ncbi:MAG: flagellar biosynthetic protein FliO [Thermodesulfobacteriota bacterium]
MAKGVPRIGQFLLALSWLAATAPVLAAEPGNTGLTGNQGTISLATALIKTLGSLAVVLGLLFLFLLLLKKLGLSRPAASREGLIRVLDIQPLSPKKQVAILELAGEYVAIGVTDQQISLLATLPANDRLRAATAATQPPPPPFAAALAKALGGNTQGKEEKSPHAS